MTTWGGGWGLGAGGRFKREGTYVCLRLIHVAVWQKPTRYCKAIILQLKKKKSDSLPKTYIQCVSMKHRRLELERRHFLINKLWCRDAGDVAKGRNLV